MLEILELCSHKDTSTIGLRLVFADALYPFAFICEVCLALNWLLSFHSFSIWPASMMSLMLSFVCRPIMLLKIVWCFTL